MISIQWLTTGTRAHVDARKPYEPPVPGLPGNIFCLSSLPNPLKKLSLRQTRGDSEIRLGTVRWLTRTIDQLDKAWTELDAVALALIVERFNDFSDHFGEH